MKSFMSFIFSSAVVCFLLIHMSVFSQPNQGSLVVGGSSDMNLKFGTDVRGDINSSNDYAKITQFNISPRVGYFFLDGLAAGLDFSIGMDKQKRIDQTIEDPESVTNTFMVGPFVRYYAVQWQAMFAPFIHASLGVGSSKTEAENWNSITRSKDMATAKYSMNGVEIGAGVALFPVEKVSIECMLGYFSTRTTNKENDNKSYASNNYIGFEIGVSVFIGY